MQTFKRIFFATDFSDCALHAQHYAFAFAKRFNADLHVGHAIDSAYPSYAGGYGFGAEVERHIGAVKQQARSDLASVADRAQDAGISCLAHPLNGRPAEAIVDKAQTLGCDLIITATHGRSGLDHFLFGSTAERIVRLSTIPVLAVKPIERDFVKNSGEFTLKRVLCPVDLSSLADQAIAFAADACRVFGAELVLLHVIDSRMEYPIVPPDVVIAPPAEFERRAIDRLNAYAASLADVKTTVMVVDGVPHKAIVEQANATGTDLIAMTTHGHGGLSRAFLGSTAEKLVRTAPVPVLTIQPKDSAAKN